MRPGPRRRRQLSRARIAALSRAAPAAALLVAALAAACGEADRGPPMAIEEVELSLLTREDLRRVVEERPEAPVRAAALGPARDVPWDGAVLPCLAMTPPARVEIELPPLGPGARLRVAAGFDAAAFELERGAVRYEIQADGATIFATVAPFGASVPPPERAWRRAEIPLDGVRRLLLATHAVGGVDAAPPAAFGLLEVERAHEVPRGVASRERPNVVIVLVDTLRADRLGAYGYDRPTSASIDAFAREGVLYERAYAASSWTFPSTASVFTGLSPPEHGVESHQSCFLAQEHDTLFEVLQRAGWTTAAWAVNPLVRPERDFDQGFGEFHEYTWARAGEVVDDVAAWLDANAAWRFCLYLHLGDPHEYRPSDAYRSRFAGAAPEGFSMSEFRRMNEESRAGILEDRARFEAWVEHMSDVYDGAVAEMDAAFGRLLALLAERGHAEDTLVVLTSDHGEAFLEHGLCLHGAHLYEEMVRVPLVLAGPGVPRGVRVADAVENRWLGATLCELAGIDRGARLPGESLLALGSLAREERAPMFFSTRQGLWTPREGAAWTRVGQLDAVRDGALLYLHAPRTPDGAPWSALYDVEADPAARTDLAGDDPAQAARLRRALEQWREHGARVRPAVLGGGRDVEELMRSMGYIGDDEDEGDEEGER